MQKHFSRSYLLIACLTALTGGCASEPPLTPSMPLISGEQMLRESQGIAHLGDRWKSGRQMADRGSLLVREGQAKMDEGNRLIEEGNKVMRESEESYRNIKH